MWFDVENVDFVILAKKGPNFGPNMANFWPKITKLAKTGKNVPMLQFLQLINT